MIGVVIMVVAAVVWTLAFLWSLFTDEKLSTAMLLAIATATIVKLIGA